MSNNDFSVHERPRPSRHAGLAALTFAGVMLAGAGQMITAAQHPEVLDFPRTLLDFREGRTTGALEKQLDQKLPVRPDLIAIANTVRYTLTGGTGEQVRPGQDGWLFLTDELRFNADGAAHLNARAALLGAAGHSLGLKGVTLVVALVPDKARVYASKLANGRYPESNRSRYQDALMAVRNHNVAVVDLLAPLARGAAQGDVYYRSDTHWNQRGAQIAANAVAQTVHSLGVTFETTTFSSANTSGPVERTGDLIRLMGLDSMPAALRPAGDVETPAATHQNSIDSPAGLFGDAVVPVALTGTSYSWRGNFHGFLQQALAAKVLNTAKDGGGFLQAASAYLTDESFRASQPKILIWEVPERFLYTKLDVEDKWLSRVGLRP